MQTDPVFGPVLSLGVGGVLTELVRDVAHLLLPVDAAGIRGALLGLRCAPLLTGYRGAPAADLDGLVSVIERVAGLVLDTPELVALEINPLIVTARVPGPATRWSSPPEGDHERPRCAHGGWGPFSRSPSTVRLPTRSTWRRRGRWDGFSPPSATTATLRVAVLRSEGARFFSAGWDLKAAAAGDAVDGDYGVGGFGGIQELPGLNKPVSPSSRAWRSAAGSSWRCPAT